MLCDISFNSSRNAQNIGVMKNIMHCLNSAQTKYVWTIGDDDPIQDRSIPYIINKFKQFDDVSLLFLNFSGRNQITGAPMHPPGIIGNRWFDVASEEGIQDGKEVFEHCMKKSVGAVIFLTAIIYRTDLVLCAAKKWKDGITNWMYLAYLAGYCAAHGRTIVTKENYLECMVAVSYWQKEPQASLLMQYKHVPEVVRKLVETGYSKRFYRSMIFRTLKDTNLRVLLGALRRWPALAVKTLVPFLTFVGGAAIGAVPTRDLRNANESGLINIASGSTEP